MTNKIVCIDTNILIWGIMKKSSSSQSNMIDVATSFFDYMDKNKYNLVLPSLVVSEILVVEPIDKQREILNILKKSFIIKEFSESTALKMAELYQNKYKDYKDFCKQEGIRKEKMKFDMAIVATAVESNCTCIYSHDPDIQKFANGIVEVKKMPSIMNQSTIL